MIRGQVNTKEQARQKAIDWQLWQSNKTLSYLEITKWAAYFNELATRFHLKTEFRENGIL